MRGPPPSHLSRLLDLVGGNGYKNNSSKLERELPVPIKEPMKISPATAPSSSQPPRLSLQPLRTQVEQENSQGTTIQERLEDLRIRFSAS